MAQAVFLTAHMEDIYDVRDLLFSYTETGAGLTIEKSDLLLTMIVIASTHGALTICQTLSKQVHRHYLIQSHKNPVRQVLSFTPFHRQGSQGSERLRDLPKATQLITVNLGSDQVCVYAFNLPLPPPSHLA